MKAGINIFLSIVITISAILIFAGCGEDKQEGWSTTKISSSGGTPVYSPDGTMIVFGEEDAQAIWLFEFGQGVAKLADTPHNWDYSWSPNSDMIVFSNPSASSNGGLWTLDLDGNLTQIHDDGQNPDYSPDGNNIVYQPAGGTGIYRMPSGGGASEMLVPFGENPEYSPDGTYIAFTIFNAELTQDSIYLYDNSAGTYSALVAGGPAFFWSPASDEIVFERYESASGSGYQLNIKKMIIGVFSPVLLWQGGSNPVWSPDGAKIAFESLSGDVTDGILMMSPTGAEAEEVANTGQEPYFGSSANKLTFSTGNGSVWVASRN